MAPWAPRKQLSDDPPESEPQGIVDLALGSLQLLAEDGVEEPLLPWPKNSSETRLRIAMPPNARFVTVRAVARSLHSTVSMYRCHAAAEPLLQQTAEILHLTARRDAPKPTTHEKALSLIHI